MEEKGFFASLFDISFTSFVTTKIIKVIYVITLVLIGLFAIGLVIGAFADSVGFGILALLVIAPLGALLYTIYARMLLELVIAIFRIMEHSAEQVRLLRASTPAAPGGTAVATPPPSPPPPATGPEAPPA
ncbi:MAG: DUF4282 domain-containing protein [Solirubrobacteraceae bacterium]